MDRVGIVDVRVTVLAEDGEDPGEVESWAAQLLTELSEVDGVAVEREAGELPSGAKGIGSAVGVLLAHVKASEAIKTLAKAAHMFALRSARGVEITIDGDTLKLTGASREQQQLAMESFLARHPIG